MTAPHLDLHTLLPKVRKAFDAKKLQCQRRYFVPDRGCQYRGPCAIGIGLSLKARSRFDGSNADSGIFDLIQTGKIKAPPEQEEDLSILQRAHDRGVLLRTLIKLEAKYAR
jgi:hypothetical protein